MLDIKIIYRLPNAGELCVGKKRVDNIIKESVIRWLGTLKEQRLVCLLKGYSREYCKGNRAGGRPQKSWTDSLNDYLKVCGESKEIGIRKEGLHRVCDVLSNLVKYHSCSLP